MSALAKHHAPTVGTYQRRCGVSLAACALAECECSKSHTDTENGPQKPAQRVILCGNTCGHNHESVNGPTGCCPEHGPFMYFCAECHQRYLDAINDAHNTSREGC